ncbi:MAG: hypothetical protein IJZ91_06700 [Oscillospiraceae bacterium]|nr:hypothetical protein [Oscillospiraceae bacterium]
MKRLYLPVLLILSLMLTGCGQNAARGKFLDFTEELGEKETLSFTADMRCEYEDKTVSFTLSYSADSEGSTVTVVAPELIRGIRAHAKGGETALEYEDLVLDTGPLDSYGLTPMSALPVLVEAIKSGYVDSVWEEKGEYAALIVPSDNMNVQLNIDKYTMCPVYAELVSDGRVTAFIHIRDWT